MRIPASLSPEAQNKLHLILEMIDSSCELAARKGPHELDPKCLCMTCNTERKKRLRPLVEKWRYHL